MICAVQGERSASLLPLPVTDVTAVLPVPGQEFLLPHCPGHWHHQGWAQLQSVLWELLWLHGLKASQFRSFWTSQAALRRKSKLTASPPLTKTPSSWGAEWSAPGHCVIPLSLPVPPHHTHLPMLTVTLEASAATGAPATPLRSDTPDTQQISPGKGVFLQLSACRPFRDAGPIGACRP